MAVASFQIMSAALFFILFYRASLWAPHAFRYHNEVRCGYDLLNFRDMLNSMDDDHPNLMEVILLFSSQNSDKETVLCLVFRHKLRISSLLI